MSPNGMEGSERRQIYRFTNEGRIGDFDFIASERSLKISINDHNNITHNLGITMRTIGDDKELVTGFLYGEGIIHDLSDIEDIDVGEEEVLVSLANTATFDPSIHIRTNTVTSACGICGRMTTEGFMEMEYPQVSEELKIPIDIINNCINTMEDYQGLFSKTGGSHACASFDINGVMMHIFEDIGRHNAMDKLVGSHIFHGKMPVAHGFVIVSGRASYELVQKSIRAGFSAIIAIGAPSTLAVDLAKEYGLTLGCFAKIDSLNIYSGARRIEL